MNNNHGGNVTPQQMQMMMLQMQQQQLRQLHLQQQQQPRQASETMQMNANPAVNANMMNTNMNMSLMGMGMGMGMIKALCRMRFEVRTGLNAQYLWGTIDSCANELYLSMSCPALRTRQAGERRRKRRSRSRTRRPSSSSGRRSWPERGTSPGARTAILSGTINPSISTSPALAVCTASKQLPSLKCRMTWLAPASAPLASAASDCARRIPTSRNRFPCSCSRCWCGRPAVCLSRPPRR